jgi:hypothetical protein
LEAGSDEEGIVYGWESLRDITDMTHEELLGFLEDAALNWLAHDGLWFQAVERRYGVDVGRQCNGEAIAAYSEVDPGF